MAVTKICPICKNDYEMGLNGTIYGCDSCTGVKRDKNNYFWNRYQKKMNLRNVATGEIETVTRAQAFGKKNG
jgi:hypothetical protein